ncbi:MAG: hypothetical protein AAF790_08830 [Planctomycetota bacterium]
MLSGQRTPRPASSRPAKSRPAKARPATPRRSVAVALAILLAIPLVASACDPVYDPVTTYTNGMPLASSTPLRSHNAYYQCDPGHTGCCGGRYNRPCLNSLWRPNSCSTGSRPAPHGAFAPEQPATVMQGVEPTKFEVLGTVPAMGLGIGGPGGQGRPAARPATNFPGLLQQLSQ